MMYKKTLHFIQKYSSIQNLSKKELWFLGAFIFVMKLLMVIAISFFDWKEGLSFYTNAGDDGQYIGYSENLYQTGEYYYDFGKSGVKDYFFRMPGMTLLYYPLRFIFNQTITINLVVIIQVLLSTLSIFKFIELINKYFNVNNLLFLFFSVFYVYSAFLDASLMTETLALSSLIFCIYYLDKSLSVDFKKKSLKYLFYSGFFLTWLIFLRPFMIPFLLLFLCYFLFRKRHVVYFITFLLPFLLIDGAWIYRNYKNHNEFVILQKSLNWYDNGNKSLPAKIHFIKSFGFKWVNFEENSQSTWFNNQFEASSIKIPDNSIFPERTFVGEMTIDSLLKAREFMHKVVDKTLMTEERIRADSEASRILNKFVRTLKEENPFDYFFLNRVRLMMSFISPNPHKLFIHGSYPMNIFITWMDVFFNILLKYIGLLGVIILLISQVKKINYLILFTSIPFYLLFLFPYVLRIDDTRFFYLSLPFLITGLFLTVCL